MYEVFMNNPDGNGRALHYYVYNMEDPNDMDLYKKAEDKSEYIILPEFLKKFEAMIKVVRKTIKNDDTIYGGGWVDSYSFTIKNFEKKKLSALRPKTIKKDGEKNDEGKSGKSIS